MGIIVSAFPGCGRSYLTQEGITGLKVINSDSSQFDSKDFPENYINFIKENIESTDILFVSSNKELREAMERESLNYDLFYPSKDRRIEFLQNYMRRGNNATFLREIDNHFNEMIDELETDDNEYCHKHCLDKPHQFISNNTMIRQYIDSIVKK